MLILTEVLYNMKRIAKIIRIRKIAVQMIPPDLSGGTSNSTISLQNLQSAQAAATSIDAISVALSEAKAAANRLEQSLNITDNSFTKALDEMMMKALSENDSVTLLRNMNLLPNVETLFNGGEWELIKTKITNDLPKAQAAQAAQTAQPAQSGQTSAQ